jgi:hypothetical protein
MPTDSSTAPTRSTLLWFLTRGILFLLLAFVPSACTVTTQPNGSDAGAGGSSATTGSAVVNWTIASGKDATQCTTYGAASIVIQLTDSTGNPYGTATTTACSAFSVTIPNLPPGTYGLTAQMVDANHAPVSTVAPSQSVTIGAGATAAVAFDFPATSFTAPTGTTGALSATWTVASTTDAAQCTTYGAASIVLKLTDSAGNPYGTATTAACSAFSVTIPNLPPGTYGVTAQMVDASSAPVSTMVPSQSVAIVAGTTATQAFDFPAASFTAPTGTTGTLNVTWTVASTTDAAQCTAHTAANIVIQLTSGGTPFGTATTAACSAFSTTIANLPPGTYGVSAQMVDVSNAPVSTMVPAQSVTVSASATAAQAFDFPSASFTN